jgi:hypothetical protein
VEGRGEERGRGRKRRTVKGCGVQEGGRRRESLGRFVAEFGGLLETGGLFRLAGEGRRAMLAPDGLERREGRLTKRGG